MLAEWTSEILSLSLSPMVAKCSGVVARLVWARNQPMVSRYIIALIECHTDDRQTLYIHSAFLAARDE